MKTIKRHVCYELWCTLDGQENLFGKETTLAAARQHYSERRSCEGKHSIRMVETVVSITEIPLKKSRKS